MLRLQRQRHDNRGFELWQQFAAQGFVLSSEILPDLGSNITTAGHFFQPQISFKFSQKIGAAVGRPENDSKPS